MSPALAKNQISQAYTVEVRNIFKGLDLIKQAGEAQGAAAAATQPFPGTQLRLQGSLPRALAPPPARSLSSRRSITSHKGLLPAEQLLHLHVLLR